MTHLSIISMVILHIKKLWTFTLNLCQVGVKKGTRFRLLTLNLCHVSVKKGTRFRLLTVNLCHVSVKKGTRFRQLTVNLCHVSVKKGTRKGNRKPVSCYYFNHSERRDTHFLADFIMSSMPRNRKAFIYLFFFFRFFFVFFVCLFILGGKTFFSAIDSTVII